MNTLLVIMFLLKYFGPEKLEMLKPFLMEAVRCNIENKANNVKLESIKFLKEAMKWVGE